MNRFVVFVIVLFSWCCVAAAQATPEAINDSDYRVYRDAQTKLGQLLFYDRVLSGTRRVSCATCHNHDRGSSNGFRLDGNTATVSDDFAVNGLEIYDALKPSSKHAPALFNLGAKEFQTLFSDGRFTTRGGKPVAVLEKTVPEGLRDVVALQALFPAINTTELVGTVDNEIAAVAHQGNEAIWEAVAGRVKSLEEYWPFVKAAYPQLNSLDELTIVEIANAIGAFVGTEWRSANSAFDRYLRGEEGALSAQQKRGMELFYGEAKCSTCHSGKFQTDHQFHFAPLGFWRFDTPIGIRPKEINFGRYTVTGDEEQKFSYRTPSLRNVEKTAPYGQAGAVEGLEQAVRSHLYLEKGWKQQYLDMSGVVIQDLEFNPEVDVDAQVDVMVDFALMMVGPEIAEPNLSGFDDPVADLTAFLKSLTDQKALEGRLGKPVDVPSSLALD